MADNEPQSRLYCKFEAILNFFRNKPLKIHMIHQIEICAETDLACNTNRFRGLKYEFLDRNLFVFHMRYMAPRPPRGQPMIYVVIGSSSHKLQMMPKSVCILREIYQGVFPSRHLSFSWRRLSPPPTDGSIFNSLA